MTLGTIRHLFPGGNTPNGFHSFYSHIIPPDARRIFVLKGGPGTGKSTFMRRIGQALAEQGFDIEFHHCSSDNGSLDGVVIPGLEVAFIDGTAPHVVDPLNPGGVDEIINLGQYWNETGMAKNKQEILKLGSRIAENFQRAYRLLHAAKDLHDDQEAIISKAVDFAAVNRMTRRLSEEIFSPCENDGPGLGKVRRLFASAITPEGPVNFLECLGSSHPRRYVITGDPGTGKSTLLQKLLEEAAARGLDAEAFHCPMSPDRIEHLIIPGLGVSLITHTALHAIQPDGAQLVDLNACLDRSALEPYSAILAFDEETYLTLFNRAIGHINEAKRLHDELETCYIPNMDFNAIENLLQQTLERVLSYK